MALPSSERQVVLVAHFDPRERDRIATALRAAGAEVVAVSDGDEALALASKRPFQLVLASCMLPSKSGFELCRTLGTAGAERAALPTVLIADADDPYVRARARHVNAKRLLAGAPTDHALRDLLTVVWDAVDPLDLSSRGGASSKNDQLFRDLLDQPKGDGDDSLMAKVTDRLTGLVNQEYLALKVQEECKRCGRYGQPLALLVAEIASFDELIEKHGRTTGDEALLEVAGVFLCESRDVDVAGRAGTARFHLLLPNTPLDGVRALARRVMESLAGRMLSVGRDQIALRVRIGVAVLAGGSKVSAEEFLHEADVDLASARLSADGLGVNVRSSEPVEPLAEEHAPPTKSR